MFNKNTYFSIGFMVLVALAITPFTSQVNQNVFAYNSEDAQWQDSDNDGLPDLADPNNQNKGPVILVEIFQVNNHQASVIEAQSMRGSEGKRIAFVAEKRIEVPMGETLLFDANKAYDPDGEITSVEWDFGEGEIKNGKKVEHVFKHPGIYPVEIKVIDDQGEWRKMILPITARVKWDMLLLSFLITLGIGVMLYAFKRFLKDKKR